MGCCGLIKEIPYRGYTVYRSRWRHIKASHTKWLYHADDYDGPEDDRIGMAPNVAECEREIDDLFQTSGWEKREYCEDEGDR